MNTITLNSHKERTKDYKKKLILEFLIKDVADIVLLYMDKHNFEYMNQTPDKNVSLLYTDGTDVYICSRYFIIINESKHRLLEHGKIVDVIDKNIILLFDTLIRQYKIYNVITSTTNIVNTDEAGAFICTNDKYIIFYKKIKIHIFSIMEMKTIHEMAIQFTDIQVVDDILYVLSQCMKKIYKYTVYGERIGTISFNGIHGDFKILNNEIIMVKNSISSDCKKEMIFYDLNGEYITRTITDFPLDNYTITKSHLYIEHNDKIYKFERTL
jgi:hypothetical protein